TKLNRELLRIGANSVWTPASPSKIEGWCMECCQLTKLTYCYGCSLAHVCQWCVQNRRCFLDNEPHLLRFRAFESPITKDKLQCIVDLYKELFPINQNAIKKFKKMTNQRKCRNELNVTWYNQLLLPITLNAAVFKFGQREVHVFGMYEGATTTTELPYRLVNHIDLYDKLLLDQINFERMSELPCELQRIYAQKYLKSSRLPSMRLKQVYYSDFTKQNLINRYKSKVRILIRNVSEFRWESDQAMHHDLVNNKDKILAALSTASVKQLETHDLNLGRLQLETFELGHHCKPNYIASEHWQPASKIGNCEWCSVKYMFRDMDWKIESLYNELMSFIQSCYKSNVNVGHCSSTENVYPIIKDIFWHSITEFIDGTIEKLFNAMNPVLVHDKRVIAFQWQIDIALFLHIKKILQIEAMPSALTLDQFTTIIKAIIDQWCNVGELEQLPLCVRRTDDLLDLQEEGKLSEEYELLISDSE
ncbi:NSP1, partial [Rotavirus G3]